MAFTATPDRSKYSVFGSKRRTAGTYASTGGSTGGDIVTGLRIIESFSSTCATGTPSTQEAISGGTVTITTTANQTGIWEAVGK